MRNAIMLLMHIKNSIKRLLLNNGFCRSLWESVFWGISWRVFDFSFEAELGIPANGFAALDYKRVLDKTIPKKRF